MIRHIFFSMALGLIASASGCASLPPISVGAQRSPAYVMPATYQQHRDQQQRFDTGSGIIAYTDHGSGPVIVLLHGVPTSSWMYRKIIPGLQANHRVISIDFLGYGSSDKPSEKKAAYGADAQAARVRVLLAHLGVERYGVMMHDMGGLVAWKLLTEDHTAITHLVVLNTIVSRTGFNAPEMEGGALTRQLVRAYSADLTSAVILEKTFDELGLTGEQELSEAECSGYVTPMREGSDGALYSFFTGLDESLFSDLDANRTRLAGFGIPTLVLWGDEDETLTSAQVPILQEMLDVADANIHIYPDHGHFLAEEIPDEIVSHVRTFMR